MKRNTRVGPMVVVLYVIAAVLLLVVIVGAARQNQMVDQQTGTRSMAPVSTTSDL